MRWIFLGLVLLAGLVVYFLGFRGQLSKEPPRIVFWDMKYQDKYMPQAASDFFADGRTMRPLVRGTVPFAGTDWFADAGYIRTANPDFLREDDAYYRGKTPEDTFVRYLPGEAVTRAGGWEPLLLLGQTQYERNCAVCHGRTGQGNGITTTYGLVGVASYHDDRLRRIADGDIYHTIVHGKNSMSSYGHQVPSVLHRWAIVAYIRVLQRSRDASAEDVPADRRAELGIQ